MYGLMYAVASKIPLSNCRDGGMILLLLFALVEGWMPLIGALIRGEQEMMGRCRLMCGSW